MRSTPRFSLGHTLGGWRRCFERVSSCVSASQLQHKARFRARGQCMKLEAGHRRANASSCGHCESCYEPQGGAERKAGAGFSPRPSSESARRPVIIEAIRGGAPGPLKLQFPLSARRARPCGVNPGSTSRGPGQRSRSMPESDQDARSHQRQQKTRRRRPGAPAARRLDGADRRLPDPRDWRGDELDGVALIIGCRLILNAGAPQPPMSA